MKKPTTKPPEVKRKARASTAAAVATTPPRIRAGSTWWGQRWIEALEHSSRDVVARLGRGRAYARDGHVHELQVKPGKVQAVVSDDDLDNYRVSLQIEVYSSADWQAVFAAMSNQALFAAQLLNGEMPRDIDKLFRAIGKSLFPHSAHDIDTDCSCEDWSSPCRHVAATHYVLGEALDRDPFLLFELRGRSREQVLAALSELRSGAALPTLQPEEVLTREVQPGVLLSELSEERFEAPLPVLQSGGLNFNFEMRGPAGALLRRLGKPASWNVSEMPEVLLAPVLERARQLAVGLANDLQPDARRSVTRGKAGTRSANSRTRGTASRKSRQDLR